MIHVGRDDTPGSYRRGGPVLLIGAAFFLSLAGCETRDASTASQTGSAAAENATRPPALRFRDWPRDPEIAEGEHKRPSLRIVSAAPNVTEICCALGLRENLAGRTRYCEYPPEIRDVPSIGALIDGSDELLMSLKPDVVLVSGHSRSVTERLEARKIKYESVPDTSIDDLFVAIRKIGGIAGRPRTAERLCDGIRRELEQVAGRFRGTPPARVLVVTGVLHDPPRPPFVAGPGSFYDGILRSAGHSIAVESDGGSFAALSLEYIVQADPDAILELDPDGGARKNGDADAVAIWARVGRLRAVANRRIYVIEGGQHYLLGPRIAQTCYEMCRRIAGES
jgi:iron complex transport system substrate-binding protein